MEAIQSKIQFLTEDFPQLLLQLDANQRPVWGKMSVIQMIDHLSDAFRQANGKDEFELHSNPDFLPRMKSFLLSDKLFKQDTKNSMLPDEPVPSRNSSVADAVEELEVEIADFIRYFDEHPNEVLLNPIFGELNFEEWVILLWKHAVHHLTQFGVIIKTEA